MRRLLAVLSVMLFALGLVRPAAGQGVRVEGQAGARMAAHYLNAPPETGGCVLAWHADVSAADSSVTLVVDSVSVDRPGLAAQDYFCGDLPTWHTHLPDFCGPSPADVRAFAETPRVAFLVVMCAPDKVSALWAPGRARATERTKIPSAFRIAT